MAGHFALGIGVDLFLKRLPAMIIPVLCVSENLANLATNTPGLRDDLSPGAISVDFHGLDFRSSRRTVFIILQAITKPNQTPSTRQRKQHSTTYGVAI